ncbi:MAG: Stp1/IreP family PP2C-type Ser/Thr phosphatase [Clostridia bacterium]|nr:Stp1/IreP family PP2C-type Ser/Thr phosphatase [Clostridia bacterium]
MRTTGASHAGRIRPSNQDAYVCGMLTEGTAFAVVCDGMGGANGGNIASAIAMRCIADKLVDKYRENSSDDTVKELLESAVCSANTAVFTAAMEDENLRGMGTTAVVAIANEQQLYVAHVGDSRAYMITHDTITQITNDHSVVQDMVEKGKITLEEAKFHPQKHFLTKALGVEDEMDCSFVSLPFPEDGTLLLCTDGLSNMVEPDVLQSLTRTFPFEEIAQKLINTANLAGGSDNITVVAVTKN